jgi:MFS family permease
MSKTPPTLKQHVRSSFRDASFTSFNVGLNESYFCAYMLILGIHEVMAGLAIIIAQFIGVVFQIYSTHPRFRCYNLVTRLIFFLTCQALMFIPLFLIGWFEISSAPLMIGVLGLYWCCVHSLNPPWMKFMGLSVPRRFRLKFFSIRNQFGQASVLFGLLCGGVLLHFAREEKSELQVFLMMLTCGLVLKLLSVFELRFKHQCFDRQESDDHRIQFSGFLKRIGKTEQGKLIGFLFLFYISVYFAAPYFTPFMLVQLKLDYIDYMLIIATSYLGRVCMFRVLQMKAKGRHIEHLLIISTIGIALSPILWTFSHSFTWLLFIEFISGCNWAAFELSTILLFYQKIDDRERISLMSFISFSNTTGMVVGSLAGALFMKLTDANLDQYKYLFMISFILRLLVALFVPHLEYKERMPRIVRAGRFMSTLPLSVPFTRVKIVKKKKKQ